MAIFAPLVIQKSPVSTGLFSLIVVELGQWIAFRLGRLRCRGRRVGR